MSPHSGRPAETRLKLVQNPLTLTRHHRSHSALSDPWKNVTTRHLSSPPGPGAAPNDVSAQNFLRQQPEQTLHCAAAQKQIRPQRQQPDVDSPPETSRGDVRACTRARRDCRRPGRVSAALPWFVRSVHTRVPVWRERALGTRLVKVSLLPRTLG